MTFGRAIVRLFSPLLCADERIVIARLFVSQDPQDRSASSSPSVRRPSSSCDIDNQEADVRANVAVADGHANIERCDDEINDDADEDDFDDTHGKPLVASFRATPSLDLELLFGAIDSHVDLHRTPLLSPLSPLPPPLAFPPPSATAGEHI